MSDVKISIRDDGPLLVSGSFELVDAEGNALPLASEKPAFALCRCGASRTKPFCDGNHRNTDFRSAKLTDGELDARTDFVGEALVNRRSANQYFDLISQTALFYNIDRRCDHRHRCR